MTQSQDNFHTQSEKIGVLLTNIGTPSEPTVRAVRRYLREFLSDKRVVEIPQPLWWGLLNGIVLPFRSRRSAKLYQTVWTEAGSPLLIHAKAQAEKLQTALHEKIGDNITVGLGMRYGSPAIAQAIENLQAKKVTKLLVLPLYPQYCAATTASTFDAVANTLKKMRWLPELRMINGYADHPAYIQALTNSVKTHWETHSRADKLVISFHGIPKRNFDKGDPYYCFCHKTARLLSEALGLTTDQWDLVFQSRFGKAKWLTPYCVETLKGYPAQGVKSVEVICPGFSADCLETLEEIDIRNREAFMKAGGQQYHYIPALNANPDHIDCLSTIVRDHLWTTTHNIGE